MKLTSKNIIEKIDEAIELLKEPKENIMIIPFECLPKKDKTKLKKLQNKVDSELLNNT